MALSGLIGLTAVASALALAAGGPAGLDLVVEVLVEETHLRLVDAVDVPLLALGHVDETRIDHP